MTARAIPITYWRKSASAVSLSLAKIVLPLNVKGTNQCSLHLRIKKAHYMLCEVLSSNRLDLMWGEVFWVMLKSVYHFNPHVLSAERRSSIYRQVFFFVCVNLLRFERRHWLFCNKHELICSSSSLNRAWPFTMSILLCALWTVKLKVLSNGPTWPTSCCCL